jgi:group I intron endonuclease
MTKQQSSIFFNRKFQQGLYTITCIPLNKHYIGESTRMKGRINSHKSRLRRSCDENAQKDFNIYGIENFAFKRLLFGACSKTKEQRLAFEKQILLTFPPEKRYNVYVDWTSRPSELNPFYGKRHTNEAILANRLAHAEKPSAFKGKKHAPEVAERISKQNKGMSSMERRKGLYVEAQYYVSVSEASRQTGRSRAFLRYACNSDRPMYANFQWENTAHKIEQQSLNFGEQENEIDN